MSSIVQVESLSKSYEKGRVKALQGVTFDVREGEMFGLVGPDGAGKTTLIRILATMLLPDSGTARVAGFDVRRDYRSLRRLIGYMPGRFSLYPDLTVEENLRFFASVFGTTIEANLGMVSDVYNQLAPFKDRRAGKLSGGMKQKLALCCALIHAPRLLLLDEPTTGVDPVSRTEFWQMLSKIRTEYGITVMASTPYMDEAERCQRIALVQDGMFLAIDSPKGIAEAYPDVLWTVRSERMHALLGDLRSWPHTYSAFSFGEAYHLCTAKDAPIEELSAHLKQRGHEDVAIEKATPSIEDCFLALSNPA